jgi:hypothetical protein
MRIDSAVRRAAADTAQLAEVFGSGDKADEIIGAACARHERVVIERVIARLRAEAAAELHDTIAVYALLWFADELDRELPEHRAPYSPEDGDVIQVTLTGTILSYDVGGDVMWELTSAEGILIPLSAEDFGTLGVIKLA